MTVRRELLRQGGQLRGPGFSLGFIATKMRATQAGGGLAVRLGIATAESRHRVDLAAGESAELPGGATLRVVNIFVSPDGRETAAAVDITAPSATDQAHA